MAFLFLIPVPVAALPLTTNFLCISLESESKQHFAKLGLKSRESPQIRRSTYGTNFRSRECCTYFLILSGAGAVFDQRPHVQHTKWQEYISCF